MKALHIGTIVLHQQSIRKKRRELLGRATILLYELLKSMADAAEA